ncbi:hypothetical protein AXF13_07960 [Desulfovibrio fairfieldensis]|uniref:Uncharacterized protein n=1 Tax=Desulfovibrio fairfieldensis TaxID=44742 RepID=A0A0X8JKH8_9BACT|nr:hypothetical protein AXF13_07960 [Desulfovibrio fairfieldensis]
MDCIFSKLAEFITNKKTMSNELLNVIAITIRKSGKFHKSQVNGRKDIHFQHPQRCNFFGPLRVFIVNERKCTIKIIIKIHTFRIKWIFGNNKSM